jgi:hypothetical protein
MPASDKPQRPAPVGKRAHAQTPEKTPEEVRVQRHERLQKRKRHV